MKLFFKVFASILIFSLQLFAQESKIGLGIYWGSALSIGTHFTQEIDNTFLIQPNVSYLKIKDGKESYSQLSNELNIGLFIFQNNLRKVYFSIGASYNYFFLQQREGNASIISDINPPYSFTGKSRENCFGLTSKIGLVVNIRTNITLLIETKYSILFPNIKYNYIPEEYSTTTKDENINQLLFGVGFGFRL